MPGWSRQLLVLQVTLAGNVAAQALREVGPGRAFVQIADAVQASAAGDRILVHPAASPYAPFTVSRGIRISCRSGVQIGGLVHGVVFDGVPAGETATLSGAGISVTALGGLTRWMAGPVITVRNSPGVVSLEGCQLTTTGPFETQLSSEQLSAVAATVLVTRCRFSGALGAPAIVASMGSAVMLSDCGLVPTHNGSLRHPTFGNVPYQAGAAIVVSGSFLVLDHTSAQGDDGLLAQFTSLGAGSAGIRTSGEVHLAGPLTAQGGRGGSGCLDFNCTQTAGHRGGTGLMIEAGSAYVDQATLLGGAGGPGTQPGGPGPAFAGGPPVSTPLPSLLAGPAVPPGGTLQLDAFAAPGSLLYLCTNFAAARQTIPGVRGVLIPRLDPQLFVVGPMLVGPPGTFRWQVAVPNDPGLRGIHLFAQTAAIAPGAFPLTFFSAAVQLTIGF